MSHTTPQDEKVQERVEDLVRKLRERGHRVTPQRLAIIRAFLADTAHPTAEQIFDRLHDQFPTMALTTVHNTLKLLVSMGEAVEMTPSAPAARFDPQAIDHCHLICIRCESITDLDCGDAIAWEKVRQHAEAAGFAPLHQIHEIYGLCRRCR